MKAQQAEMNLDMLGFEDVSLDEINVSNPTVNNYPKRMMDIYNALNIHLNSNQTDIALAQLKAICKAFGGIQYYLACCRSQIRDIQIWCDFNGSNVAELSKKYDISMQNVYRILKKMREMNSSTPFVTAKTEAEAFDKNLQLFPESTQEMYLVIKEELRKHGIGTEVAYCQLMDMSDKFGSQQFYVPSGRKLESEMKKFKIWREYNGHNITELSEKYKVSMAHIWRVLANMRSLAVKKYQIPLF